MRSKKEIQAALAEQWQKSQDELVYAQDVEEAKLEVLIDIRDLIKKYLEIECDIKGL